MARMTNIKLLGLALLALFFCNSLKLLEEPASCKGVKK